MAVKGCSAFPKLQHHWNLTIWLFSVISRTLVGGGLTPLQRSSRCILQPQPTGQGNEGVLCIPQSFSITEASPLDCLVSYQDIRWRMGILPLCRDTVNVKSYSILLTATKLEPHHKMQYSIILWTFLLGERILTLCKGYTVSVFKSC